jgi:lipopolysaccharide export LptBFGC system permease protein LptF
MIKMILAFVFLFVIFYTGIEIFNKMTGQEKWEVAKTFSYSIALAIGVIVFMVCLVVLF